MSIAYQVFGSGSVELVVVPSFVSNLDLFWANPVIKTFFDRLAAFARVAIFDKAGTGLSDPVVGVPTIEHRAAEVAAVIDAADFERPALLGLSEGGPASIVFASTRPEKTRALILAGTYPISVWSLEEHTYEELAESLDERGFPRHYLPTTEQFDWFQKWRPALDRWGSGEFLEALIPSSGDARQLALIERSCASPGMVRATVEAGARLDVRSLLPAIDIPTLVIHATDDPVPVQLGRYLADHIPGARLLEIEGHDHAPWFNEPKRTVNAIEHFLTGSHHAPAPSRMLATILFTDIVDSTRTASEVGDALWRAMLERHDQLVRRELARFDGREVKATGDGFLATFAAPAQAIRCAESIRESAHELDLRVRAGVHTGECEVIGGDIGGLAVHIGARVGALAGPDEVLVSSTVRDLVIGSGIGFSDRGEHDLKGVPGAWRLLAVRSEAEPDSDEAYVAGLETPPAASDHRFGDRMVGLLAHHAPGLLRASARMRARRPRGEAPRTPSQASTPGER